MMKYNMELRIIFLFVSVIVAIFVTAFLAQYALTGTDLSQTLGFSLKDECSGSLFLSVSEPGTCLIKARVLTSECKGKSYEIREGSCFGNVKCENIMKYDSYQATCVWTVPSGNYEYVLCIDNKQKDSGTISC